MSEIVELRAGDRVPAIAAAKLRPGDPQQQGVQLGQCVVTSRAGAPQGAQPLRGFRVELAFAAQGRNRRAWPGAAFRSIGWKHAPMLTTGSRPELDQAGLVGVTVLFA